MKHEEIFIDLHPARPANLDVSHDTPEGKEKVEHASQRLLAEATWTAYVMTSEGTMGNSEPFEDMDEKFQLAWLNAAKAAQNFQK